MIDIVEKVKTSLVRKYFERILDIPCCSRNEAAVSDLIITVAKRCNLVWNRDEFGNIIVSIPATPGLEDLDQVIFHSHIDTVCETNSKNEFKYIKDSINSEIKYGWIQSYRKDPEENNEIDVATALAVMEDELLEHSLLELHFAVSEMNKPKNAMKIELHYLPQQKPPIIDTKDSGEFPVPWNCGPDTELIFPLKRTKSNGGEFYRLKIFSFKENYSGVDVNHGNGNAIKFLVRLLWELSKQYSFELVCIEGGSKRKPIPCEAWADLIIESSELDLFSVHLTETFKKVKKEYKTDKENTRFSLERNGTEAKDPLEPEDQKKLINLLFTLPQGVYSMNHENKYSADTTTNLDTIQTHQDKAKIICSSRSSLSPTLEATKDMIRASCELIEAEVKPQEESKNRINPNTPILDTLKEVYQRMLRLYPEEAKSNWSRLS